MVGPRIQFLKKAHLSIIFQFTLPEQMHSNPTAGRGPAKRQLLLLAKSNPISSGIPARLTVWPRWGRERPGVADLMMPVYTSPQQRLVIFLLDVSDSMSETLDLMRLWMAKSMGEAYFRRDPIAIITVQGAGAKLLVHPTTSIHFVLHRLTSVIVGGATPLDQGLLMVGRMIRQWHHRYPVVDLIVISDGRSTGSLADTSISEPLALIRKFVREALVINPIPIADRFARAFAALIGAQHFTTE
jgi:Mg-chelatase subunit ChlD